MKRALFPGTFDPFTNGHYDIVERASRLFDSVIVLVASNSAKKTLFSVEERVDMIERSLSSLSSVSVDSWDGLTVRYAEEHGCSYIVRGIRDSADFSYEHELELNNAFILPSVETVYLSSSSENLFLRSTSIRDYVRFGVDFSSLVPRAVYSEIMKKMSPR